MKEVFLYFLRLGMLGFGGPIATIAQMHRDLVEERKWISNEQFLQVFPLIKSMPGPVSFQTAVYLGHARAGFWGGTIAGVALVLPAFVMMILLAHFHAQFEHTGWIRSVMFGFHAGAVALIAFALVALSKGLTKQSRFWIATVVGFCALQFFHISEFIVILATLVIALAFEFRGKKTLAIAAVPVVAVASSGTLFDLFWLCFKSGAIVFGTGLAIIPLLENAMVHQYHWLSSQEFMDALAFGQLTPGPVVITVTYVGYKILGMGGATVATLAIFLPSFIHMTTWFPHATKWLSRQSWIKPVTTALAGAVVASILWALLRIGREFSPMQIGLSVLLLIALVTLKKIPSWLVVVIGGLLGLFAL